MTSQIFTIDGRLRALLALLKVRQADQTIVKKVNKFVEYIRGPSEIRNRTIHDPWGNQQDGSVTQFEITANKSLTFRIKKVEVSELESRRDQTYQCIQKYIEIKEAIEAALPTLPKIPHSELHPIREVRPPPT